MNEASWERTADGTCVRVIDAPPRVTRSGLMLKEVAIAKMIDVSIISAEFSDTLVVFEPWAWVFLDMGTVAEFMGVYKLGFPLEESQEELPSLCLRRSLWNRDYDFEQFNLAENKKAYIESDKQVNSRIIFTTTTAHLEIYQLITKILMKLRLGVGIEATERPESHWHSIRCEVADESIAYSFSYTPFVLKNDDIEAWIFKWRDAFEKINFFEEGYIPDKGCKVSYRLSLREQLTRFSS